MFADNDDSFLDEGVHVVVFSLVDNGFLVCNDRLSWGVTTFRSKKRPLVKSVDRSIAVP